VVCRSGLFVARVALDRVGLRIGRGMAAHEGGWELAGRGSFRACEVVSRLLARAEAVSSRWGGGGGPRAGVVEGLLDQVVWFEVSSRGRGSGWARADDSGGRSVGLGCAQRSGASWRRVDWRGGGRSR